MRETEAQAVVWQTAINPVVALELLEERAAGKERVCLGLKRSTPSLSSRSFRAAGWVLRDPRREYCKCRLALEQTTEPPRSIADRERYVARGVATTPLVVARAEGARIWDVDGREYVDFAGGLGCQNTGHGFAAAAIHEQVDRYLHQCFMVGMYEPYVEVCKLLDESWPG